jgi:hypothetical protein
MREQHLSDEAVAACADDVLTGLARDRARRHTAVCAECAVAVADQREAVWALRAAPAPALPLGLLDRLRDVPSTTPLAVVPGTVAADGSAMFAAFGTMSYAALAPSPAPSAHRNRHVLPIVTTAAAVAVAGILAVGSATPAAGGASRSGRPAHPVQMVDVGGSRDGGEFAVVSTRWTR